jgi:aminoglycoside 2'-N-acetyltransferase I
MSEMMGDVVLTGTLIEGSIALKHRNLAKHGGFSGNDAPRPAYDGRAAVLAHRAKNEHRDRRPERGRIMAEGRTADECGLAARHVVEKLPWGHIKWAHADLRVLIDAPEDVKADSPAMSASTSARDLERAQGHIGGIGGVATREDCRAAAMPARAQRRDPDHARPRSACGFALLFCEPHNFAFYQARGWHPFTGEVYAEQPEGRIRFEAMAPFVFDFTRKPRDGTIDLCGLPW